ncbi:MAG: TetR/AcrR family transcriptional regulator [Solirubrobacteraceae bacterium]
MASDQVTPRERLLDVLITHLGEHGLRDMSLRGLASAAGTSHRMLSYHFGSRDGLLVALTQEVERRQLTALADLRSEPDASPTDVMWSMYRRLTDPALWPLERLFFELYTRALQAEPAGRGFSQDAVEGWIAPLAPLFERLGFRDADAIAEARLAIGVCRGLLLDLLATGDRTAVDAAMSRYMDRYDKPR